MITDNNDINEISFADTSLQPCQPQFRHRGVLCLFFLAIFWLGWSELQQQGATSITFLIEMSVIEWTCRYCGLLVAEGLAGPLRHSLKNFVFSMETC
jgi:hypothetical protein